MNRLEEVWPVIESMRKANTNWKHKYFQNILFKSQNIKWYIILFLNVQTQLCLKRNNFKASKQTPKKRSTNTITYSQKNWKT